MPEKVIQSWATEVERIAREGIFGEYDRYQLRQAADAIRLLERRAVELEKERDRLRQCLEDLVGHLDYLQDLWGAEGVTRRVVQQVRECLKGESEAGE